jgi:hypothetical protein
MRIRLSTSSHTLSLLLLCFAIAFISIATAQIPSDSLVLYMPFNGDADDYSGTGNHGAVFGATPTNDRFGNANSAYLFQDNDWIEVPHASSLDFSLADNYSISVWFKVNGQEDKGSILEKWNQSTDPYPYILRVSNPLGPNPFTLKTARFTGGTNGDSLHAQVALVSNETSGLDTNTFHHAVAVFTPSLAYLYLDGILCRQVFIISEWSRSKVRKYIR